MIPLAENATPQHPGLQLGDYSEAKGLPEDFLRSLGLSDFFYRPKPAVRIPYLDEDGREAAVRFRLSMHGPDRFRWRKGDHPLLYGLWRLGQARERQFVVTVEGESDCHTL